MSGSSRQPAGSVPPPVGDRSATARAPSHATDTFPVVGIGASAGGLDACRKFLDALPGASGMAFIVVQHLDPTHESLLVDLLANHTSLKVVEAADAMPLKRDHVYVIPPGAYLSIADGALRVSQPRARHGARLPFDFLLHSLATECGARAICVILSGSGDDGSLGLQAINNAGGLVIAQDPEEAAYDGMPRSAIATGAVDRVLRIAEIPAALLAHDTTLVGDRARTGLASDARLQDGLGPIVELLRAKTAHDFTLYKPGTLRRRIERRVTMAGIAAHDLARYLARLREDEDELELLANDLLINVTSFFRDPNIFDYLAEKIVPDLVRGHAPDRALRIWIAGCSTGEETYSLAMLFREEITAAKLDIKLQIFASDVDPGAVATAREGLYPATIAADVSPARLERFFSREDTSYRISPELRSAVVFTVQDVLADPPFSRLDLISCRNLLIYLRPEAQAKVISAFHFALREDGVLLLGNTETAGDLTGRFKVISKAERLYRRIGRSRPGDFGVSKQNGEAPRVPARAVQEQTVSREAALADLCRKLIVETYAPAAVLINSRHECLYSLGPTDRYLRVAPGSPTHDLFAMVRPGLRNRLRSAIQRAKAKKARVSVAGGSAGENDQAAAFGIEVHAVASDGEDLLLICFLDEPAREERRGRSATVEEAPRIAELERELAATRLELQGAIHSLEISGEEQKAINEEALSVNEEHQSTNEELLTSKEELQSLNEELTALNTQLHETLDRQRTTSNDLQNVLYSTAVATLFLDAGLNIRFFTPATKLLFNVIPTDVGRPLADLRSLAADTALSSDAHEVLRSRAPIEREIETYSGSCFIRRILPYRTQDDGIEGVVITFTDISDSKRVARALEAATREAELANIAKTRFLAAANHDLRQPLQTLALLQGLLAKAVMDERGRKLVTRLDETLGAMSGMLNTLLDINQIETGTVQAEKSLFPIGELLNRLQDEFTYHAHAQRLDLRVVASSLVVNSDPRLLEQMLRNLISNALKYTKRGKILLGCRRRPGVLSIEIWDTGIGIPAAELKTIFEEYHQLDNDARERSRGLGLGLSIVQQLGKLLDHPVHVRSELGRGSVFTVEIPIPDRTADAELRSDRLNEGAGKAAVTPRAGLVLIVEDDPEVRELLEFSLEEEGYSVLAMPDGPMALEQMTRDGTAPSLILADFNLPKGLNGLQFIARVRSEARREIPAIILTGDISTATLREVARHNCVQLNKPLKLPELLQTIRRLMPPPPRTATPARARPAVPARDATSPTIFVVDDDDNIREAIRLVLEEDGRTVEDFADCEAFLAACGPDREGCLLIDAYLPGMNGLQLLARLKEAGYHLPAIMITGNSDVPMAVQAMKAGASDFIEKPVSGDDLIASIARALEQSKDSGKLSAWRADAATHIAGLTSRQREVMEMVLAGHPSKNIAADLGISQRTVENHRASIMKRTGSKSLPALARLALAAASNGTDS